MTTPSAYRDSLPSLTGCDSADAVLDDLEQFVADAEFQVEVRGRVGPGTPLDDDWWFATFEPLWIEHCDYGLDATLIGLTELVSRRVGELLGEPGAENTSEFPLLLRLWLADRRGRLGKLLEQSARFFDFDYEKLCAEEVRRSVAG